MAFDLLYGELTYHENTHGLCTYSHPYQIWLDHPFFCKLFPNKILDCFTKSYQFDWQH